MNLDEFNDHQLRSFDERLSRSILVRPFRHLIEDVRPDDLMTYFAGRLAAAEPFASRLDADQAREVMPPEMDPDLEPGTDDLESETSFWRGVFEQSGVLRWKQMSLQSGVKAGADGPPRHPLFICRPGRRLLLGLWRWVEIWSAYPHLALKIRRQIDDKGEVWLFGVDALFMVRNLYSPNSLGVFTKIAAAVSAWRPPSGGSELDPGSQFGIKPRDVSALRRSKH